MQRCGFVSESYLLQVVENRASPIVHVARSLMIFPTEVRKSNNGGVVNRDVDAEPVDDGVRMTRFLSLDRNC